MLIDDVRYRNPKYAHCSEICIHAADTNLPVLRANLVKRLTEGTEGNLYYLIWIVGGHRSSKGEVRLAASEVELQFSDHVLSSAYASSDNHDAKSVARQSRVHLHLGHDSRNCFWCCRDWPQYASIA